MTSTEYGTPARPVPLSDEDAIATLTCHLPAGTTTGQAPDWNSREVAQFLHERLTDAGYAVVAVREPAYTPARAAARWHEHTVLADAEPPAGVALEPIGTRHPQDPNEGVSDAP